MLQTGKLLRKHCKRDDDEGTTEVWYGENLGNGKEGRDDTGTGRFLIVWVVKKRRFRLWVRPTETFSVVGTPQRGCNGVSKIALTLGTEPCWTVDEEHADHELDEGNDR
jgi:hypothetical protein